MSSKNVIKRVMNASKHDRLKKVDNIFNFILKNHLFPPQKILLTPLVKLITYFLNYDRIYKKYKTKIGVTIFSSQVGLNLEHKLKIMICGSRNSLKLIAITSFMKITNGSQLSVIANQKTEKFSQS